MQDTASDNSLHNGLRLLQNVQFKIKTPEIDLSTPVQKLLAQK